MCRTEKCRHKQVIVKPQQNAFRSHNYYSQHAAGLEKETKIKLTIFIKRLAQIAVAAKVADGLRFDNPARQCQHVIHGVRYDQRDGRVCGSGRQAIIVLPP